jgi:D-alanyl-D-alanine carboxypeptidase
MILTDTLITRFPERYHYFGMTSCKVAGQMLTTHNGFLGLYKGADGLKTGYTRDAGYNLIASVERKGHRLVGIELGADSRPARDARMVKLMDHAFGELGIPRDAENVDRVPHATHAKHVRLLAAAAKSDREERSQVRRGTGRGHSRELEQTSTKSHSHKAKHGKTRARRRR